MGLLMGDMMEKVEAKYLEERSNKASEKELPSPEAPKKKSFAGFFSGLIDRAMRGISYS